MERASDYRSRVPTEMEERLSSQATGKTERVKQERLLTLNDASIVTQWLNSAQDAKARASYGRVVSIRQQLENLQRLRERFKEFGPDPKEDARAWRKYEEERAKVKAGQKAKPVTFPAYRDSQGDRKLQRQTNRLASRLNEALSQYTFRPQMAHVRVGFSVLQNLWAGGMVPDAKEAWFQMKVNGWTISEADAALALVRLDLVGEVSKVGLCEQCRRRWRVAAKTHYRFCGKQCRLEFYASSDNYRRQRVEAQQRYRDRRKLFASQLKGAR